MLYSYIKKAPAKHRNFFSKKNARIISGTLLFIGLILIGQVVFPITSAYIRLIPQYTDEIASPLASYFQPTTPSLFPKAVQAASSYDAYRPSTWFVADNSHLDGSSRSLHAYTISIPKLKIENAVVEIGGDNLKKSLIAWPSSALPGSYGVNIVFGHSELPSLASPKDYAGIFTFIMDLKNDDEIFIDFSGVRYKYRVFDKKVIEPTNLSVLEQRFDQAYLTLITCVPPGTLWKRGVVKAKLINT